MEIITVLSEVCREEVPRRAAQRQRRLDPPGGSSVGHQKGDSQPCQQDASPAAGRHHTGGRPQQQWWVRNGYLSISVA